MTSYGKLMMWFYLSDALTFSGFGSLWFSRFKFRNGHLDEVFTHFRLCMVMYYVALMTFILIFSSVTMVLAVDAGHQMKDKVVLICFNHYGGGIFVGSQAWEWKNFIKVNMVLLKQKGLLQFVDKEGNRVALADFAVNFTRRKKH
jgi:cytochrome c oxidase subunit 3